MSGIKALFDAMNIAYAETEKRSFLRLNIMSIGFTIGALMIGIVLLLAVGVVHVVLWPILMLAVLTGYRSFTGSARAERRPNGAG